MSSRNPIAANRPTTGSAKPRSGTAERRRAFAQAYIANGHNATQAAIAAGYSAKTARSQGQRLLTKVDIRNELAAVAEKTAEAAEVTITEALRQAKAIMQSDVRAYFDKKGDVKPVHTWSSAMSAAVSSVKVDYIGVGKKRRVASVELKFWDKNSALGQVMRHLGMFENDNVQKMPNLNVQLLFVGPPE